MKLISSFLFWVFAITVSLSQTNNLALITLDSVVSSVDGFTFFNDKYLYDAGGRIIQKIEFDVLSGTDKNDYEYDKNGNKISEVKSYKSYGEESFRLIERSIFTYEGPTVLKKIYNWNNDSVDWVIRNQSKDYLNEKRLVDSTIHSSWDTQTMRFKPNLKTYIEYNQANNQTLHLYLYPIGINNSWVPKYKDEFSYENNENLNSFNNYYWIDSTNSWDLNYTVRYDYTYDLNNNTIKKVEYSDGEPHEKIEYFYDSKFNRNKEITFSWDEETEGWVAEDSLSFEFGEELAFEDVIFGDYPTDYFQFFSRPVSAKTDFGLDDESFPLDIIFYYSDFRTVGISDVIKNKVEIYPNPAQKRLNFEKQVNKLTIQDLTGKVRIQSNNNPIKELDVSELENGSYILLLETDNGLTSEKLLISK